MRETIIKRIPEILITAALCLATIIPYWQVRNFEFTTYDDDVYITNNPHVQRGFTSDAFRFAFSLSGYASNWHPLTWLSHTLDCTLFGVRPGPHHLINLFLHIVNAILLFLALRVMTGAVWRSAFVAFLFALHPLHVESVAWVSERKDVLSTLFWFAALFAYFLYVKNGGVRRYLTLVLLFALGLLAKPMLVTLPFTLLLLDVWPLRRLELSALTMPVVRRLVIEKAPLLLLSIVSSIVTYIAQQKGGSVGSLEILPPLLRVANAIVSFGAYLWKMAAPFQLAFLYPHPIATPWDQIAISLACISTVTALVLAQTRQSPFLCVGWLWYLGTLIPVIGFVQVGSQSLADRYTYVPYIGIFVMIAWGIPELLARFRLKNALLWVAALCVLIAFAARTKDQARYWKDSETLFRHAIAITENNSVARNNLAGCLEKEGKLDEAVAEYYAALADNPENASAHNNIGNLLAEKGKFDEALRHYAAALKIRPDFSAVQNNLGFVLAGQGKFNEAIAHYKEAVRLDPDDPRALNNLGMALEMQGKTGEAIQYYSSAQRLFPNNAWMQKLLGTKLAQQGKIQEAAGLYGRLVHTNSSDQEARINLAKLLLKQGKTDEALGQFKEALLLDSNNFDIQSLVGVTLAQHGMFEKAVVHFRQAVRINPNDAGAQDNLGLALSQQGKIDEALHCFYEALRLDPRDYETQSNLGMTLAKLGRLDEAISYFRQALHLKPGFSPAQQNLDLAMKKRQLLLSMKK